MTAKIGKSILYLNVFAVLFIGILDDININVVQIYLALLGLEQLLIVLMLMDKKKSRLRDSRCVFWAAVVWLVYMAGTAVCARVNTVSVGTAIYSYCSAMVLFWGSIVFWDSSDVQRAYRIFQIWYVLNLVLSILEFALFDKRNDMLGGFIGCRMGSNEYMNLLHCAMLIAVLAESFSENRLKPYTVFVIFASVLLASLQELKFFYIEFLLILFGVAVIYAAQKRLGWKTVCWTVVLAAASIGIGLIAMYYAYPKHFAVMVGTKSYARYEETSRVSYGIGRVHFIREINELWFHGGRSKNLFGLGFGAVHPGTDFYAANEQLNYYLFAHQMLFLEGGIIGLVLFELIFAASALYCGWDFLRNRPMSVEKTFGVMFSLIMMLNILYNDAVHNITAMLIWPMMAVPYIVRKGGEQADAISSEGTVYLR